MRRRRALNEHFPFFAICCSDAKSLGGCMLWEECSGSPCHLLLLFLRGLPQIKSRRIRMNLLEAIPPRERERVRTAECKSK